MAQGSPVRVHTRSISEHLAIEMKAIHRSQKAQKNAATKSTKAKSNFSSFAFFVLLCG
jgi:hypothetical protein